MIRQISSKHAVVAVIALVLAALSPLTAHAATARIDATAVVDAGNVVVRGNLTSDGEPVRNVVVRASLGEASQEAPVDNAGNFGATIPIPDGMSGSASVNISFAGRGNIPAVSKSVSVNLGGGEDSGATGSLGYSEPSEEASQEPEALVLEAALSAETVHAGNLLEATGTVTDEEGSPAASREVNVSVNGTVLENSVQFTGDDGAFSTYVELPGDLPEGEATVTVEVSNHNGDNVASEEITVKVAPVVMESATPTESAAPSPSASPTEEAVDERATPSAAPVTAATNAAPPAGMEWFVAAMIVVGGATVIVAMALVLRAMHERNRGRRPSSGGVGVLTNALNEEPPIQDAGATPRRAV